MEVIVLIMFLSFSLYFYRVVFWTSAGSLFAWIFQMIIILGYYSNVSILAMCTLQATRYMIMKLWTCEG